MTEALVQDIALPAWLFWPLLLFACWSLLDRALLPWMRWLIRNRVRRVLEELDERLPIKLDEFRLTRRQVLINRLLYDPAIQSLAEEHMRQSLQSRDKVMAEIEGYVREIVPAFNPWVYFNIMARLTRWLVTRLYVLRIDHQGDQPLADLPDDATVVYVMNHRSNIDYLMVGHISSDHTALSFAAGEWARFWPLEPLIRLLGAYFVRRNSQNPLYRKVLERYVSLSTREGVTQAVFPEGGLSRDGAMRAPKLGLLGYMLRDFDPAVDRDVVFVPVAMNYDRVLEDRTLLASMDPNRPAPGLGSMVLSVLRYAWLNLRLLATRQWRRYGMAAVTFGAPVSAAAWLAGHANDARDKQIEHLAGQLMTDLQSLTPVLAAPSFCVALLQDPEKRWTDADMTRFFADNRWLAALGTEEAIPAALQIIKRRRFIIPDGENHWVMNTAETALLRYYARSIAPDSA